MLQLIRAHFNEGSAAKVIVQLMHLLKHEQVGRNELVLDEVVRFLEHRMDCGIGREKFLLHRQGFLASFFLGFPTAIANLWLFKSRRCWLVEGGARAAITIITLLVNV